MSNWKQAAGMARGGALRASALPAAAGAKQEGMMRADDKAMAELFSRVRARLRAGLGEDVYSSWFVRLELEELVDDLAHLSVPTRFLCSWIQSNYAERILAAFKAEDAAINRLHLAVRVNGQARPRLVADTTESDTAPAIAAEPAPRPHPMALAQTQPADALAGSAIDKRMSFDSFVTGAANEMALGAARQVADSVLADAVAYNPVYIHSSVGLGKSHLLNAIANAVTAANPHKNVVYLTADHFMYNFITAVQRQSALAFKDWLRRIDLLLIDDMQFLQGKSATEFGHTLSTLITGARQVVVAGDSAPRDLDMLDERVRSRLSGGLVVEIDTFDVDLRRAIVTTRAELAGRRFGVQFPGPVIEFIAQAVVSHGRDLDGAVNRLVAANQLTGRPVTIGIAEKTLSDLIRAREGRKVRIEDILRVVSRHFKVARTDLLSSRRSRDVVHPRQVAMYLAKVLTARSLPEIGRRFGGRDHTTVLHSVRKIEQAIKADGALEQEIELLKKMLEE